MALKCVYFGLSVESYAQLPVITCEELSIFLGQFYFVIC